MKKLSLLFLLAVSMVAGITAREPMIFMREPLYVYPDGTIVYNILGVDSQKVVTLQNPDKTYIIGTIRDPKDSLTIENIKSSIDATCSLSKKIIHGNVLDSIGNYKEKMFYGVKESELQPLTESIFITGRKWHFIWWGDDLEYNIIFEANGTGTCSCIKAQQGFANQVKSGNARGSNQYQTRNKNYAATGGITGGYYFVIEALINYKIKWSIKDNHLYVNGLPYPTVKIKRITTSMDDSNKKKTPSMTEKQWVKQDLKYNSDVKMAKDDILYTWEQHHPMFPFIDSDISGYTDGVMIYWDRNGKWKTLKKSGFEEKSPWNLINKETYKLFDKCDFGLSFEIQKLNFAKNNYQEIGDYCFDGLVGQRISISKLEEWLNMSKFSGDISSDNQLLSLIDFKKITSITACDSIEYNIKQDKSFWATYSEQLQLKLYYVITTKKGRRFLTDVCVAFDESYSPLLINGDKVNMRFNCSESFTILKEIIE